MCINLLPHLLSSPTSSLSSYVLPFLSLTPLYFISFHHPYEQKCMEEKHRTLLSIKMSLNVRTRSLLLQKACHTLVPHNADLRTRCSGNIAEYVVINCAEIYGLHKVLSMPFYVRSLAEMYKCLCSFKRPGVPGHFLSGYSESPDGLMYLISRSHKPLWTSSTGPLWLEPRESGNSQCSLGGAK